MVGDGIAEIAKNIAPVMKAPFKAPEAGVKIMDAQQPGALTFLKDLQKDTKPGGIFEGLGKFARPETNFQPQNKIKTAADQVATAPGIKLESAADTKTAEVAKPLSADEQLKNMQKDLTAMRMENKQLKSELSSAKAQITKSIEEISALKVLTKDQKDQILASINAASTQTILANEASGRLRDAQLKEAIGASKNSSGK